MEKEHSRWEWVIATVVVLLFFVALWNVMSRDVEAAPPEPGGIEDLRESNLELQGAYEENVRALRLLADNVIAQEQRIKDIEEQL